MRPIAVGLLLILSVVLVQGAVYTGSLDTPEQWKFLARFAFSNQFDHNDRFQYVFQTESKSLQVLLYLLAEDSNPDECGDCWQNVYRHRPGSAEPWSCQKLSEHASSELVVSGRPGEAKINVEMRAYFFYVAVADCNNTGIHIDSYTLTFLNPGPAWFQQFSYDQQGILQIYIAFTVFYLLLAGAHAFGVVQQVRTESWHPIIRVLGVAIGLQVLSVLAEVIHYGIYANNGVGAPVMCMASEVVLMFLCILIAKGWAITTSYLTEKHIILIVNALLVLAYLALFVWDRVATDPASTLYFYDTIPGIVVVVLRVGILGWFLWSLRNTIRLESLPEKRNFYMIFGACYSAWFLLLPLIVLFAYFLAPHVRFRAIQGLSISVDFLGLAALAVLLWPSRASKYFVIKASPQLLTVKDGGYGSTAQDAISAL